MIEDSPLDEKTQILCDQVAGLGYRALATAHSLGSAIRLAPTLTLKKLLVEYIREELRRFESASDAYVQLVPGEDLLSTVDSRLTQIPAPESWLELVVIQFLFDRAGELQLKETVSVENPVLRKLAGDILESDHMHFMMSSEAANALRNMLIDDPDLTPQARVYIDRWLAISLRSFGRPGTERGKRAIALGLKRRDSAEVIREYVASIEPILNRVTLKLPSRAQLGLDLPSDIGLA